MSFVAVGVTVAGAGIAGYQAYKAKQSKDAAAKDQQKLIDNRPQYQIPGQYQKNVDLQTGVVNNYDPYTKTNLLPGQAYMQNRVDNNSANAIAKAGMDGVSSSSQYAQMLGAVNASQNESTTDMNIAGAQNRMKSLDGYARATNDLVGANKDLADQNAFKWDQNTFSPYASSVAMKTNQIRDATQRQREREDSAIQTGVAAGSMAGSGVSAKRKPSGSTNNMNSYTTS